MAGFEVIIYGRFWVIAEVIEGGGFLGGVVYSPQHITGYKKRL